MGRSWPTPPLGPNNFVSSSHLVWVTGEQGVKSSFVASKMEDEIVHDYAVYSQHIANQSILTNDYEDAEW